MLNRILGTVAIVGSGLLAGGTVLAEKAEPGDDLLPVSLPRTQVQARDGVTAGL